MDKDLSSVEYRIRVVGLVDQEWSSILNDLQIHSELSDKQQVITTLRGPLADQAALFGVLNFLYNQRYLLLSVDCLNCND